MKYLLLIMVLGLVSFVNAFAEPLIMLDKQSYIEGDIIRISGKVQYEQGMFVLIQLRSQTDIVGIDQIFPSQSGSFSSTFEAEGPKWQQSGTYTVMVSYQGQTAEKSFQYTKPVRQEPVEENKQVQHTQPVKPKITIKGFPDIMQPPQHYYDRYDNEPEFKTWFDSIFAGHTIHEIVGYRHTHVAGFPDPQYSPQYYIERYTHEAAFQEWFDLQFPEKTIHDVVGVPEEVKVLVPSWVKQYARWWATNAIDDTQFASRISELIKQGIITLDSRIPVAGSTDNTIPNWFKNNARWYSDGHITEEDFLRGIEYLVENRIIII